MPEKLTYPGDVTLTTSVDEEITTVMDSLAEDSGISISEHLRRAIVVYLDYLHGGLVESNDD